MYTINYETIVSSLKSFGIEENECTSILSPLNVDLVIEDGEDLGSTIATLTWESPYPNEDVTYNVYRNDDELATNTSETSFTDLTLTEYLYNYTSTTVPIRYCVEAIKDNQTSNKVCKIEDLDLCVPPYGLIEITTLKDGEVNLAWNFVYYTNLIEKLQVVRNDEVIDEVGIKELSENNISYYYTDKDESLNLDEFYQYKIVAVYSDGCSAESESIFVKPQPSSINDNLNNISIYPNPATDIVNIKGNDIQSVEVYNVLGQIIEVIDNIDVNNLTINTSNYSNGTYLIKITTNSNNITINKLLKY